MSVASSNSKKSVTLKNWRLAPYNQWAFNNVRGLMPTENIPPSKKPASLLKTTENLLDISIKTHKKQYSNLNDYLISTHTDSFIVLRKGKVVCNWYNAYSQENQPHIIFSISKSLTALLSLHLSEIHELDLNKKISYFIPETKGSAYEDATARNLLDMNVSSNFEENYLDQKGIFYRYRNATGWNAVVDSEGLRNFLPSISKGPNPHGEVIHYCSPHTDMLGWLIETVSKVPFSKILAHTILQPCGIEFEAYVTVDSYGTPRAAGGVNICALDLARVGELMRCKGTINGIEVLKEESINDICHYDNKVSWANQIQWADNLFPAGRYRSCWYQTQDPENEIFGSGIHGQWLWVNPTKQVTIVKLSSLPLPLDLEAKREAVAGFRQITDQFID